ncbi:MAG: hypothetical protein ACHREM_24875, partial [Polyangiales bacterium]
EIAVDSTGPARAPTARKARRKPIAKAKVRPEDNDQDGLRARLTDAIEKKKVAPKDLVEAGIFRIAEYARTFRKDGRQIKPEQAKALDDFLTTVALRTRVAGSKSKKQQRGA